MTDKLTDEQAAEQFIWLTNNAGTELQLLAGGAVHAPAFNKAAVDYLNQIADVAKALAHHYKDDEDVEDTALTPIEDLSEDTQKAVKEQEKEHREADKQAEAEAKEQEKAAAEQAKAAEHNKPKSN